jgi:hypothetical protein
MSAPDLTAVKAMLFDALTEALDTRGGTLATSINTDINGFEKFVVAGPSQTERWTYAAIRTDKLATTVAAWFAAREAPSPAYFRVQECWTNSLTKPFVVKLVDAVPVTEVEFKTEANFGDDQ